VALGAAAAATLGKLSSVWLSIPRRILLPHPGLGWADAVLLLALTGLLALVARIHTALSAKKNHRLSEGFFLDLFEEHFSAAEARRQLDTAIQWGRYAELFEYDADTGELLLAAGEAGAPG